MSNEDCPTGVFQHADIDANGNIEYGLSVTCKPDAYKDDFTHDAIKALLDDTQQQIDNIIKLGAKGTYCAICRQYGHSRLICQAYCTPCPYGERCKYGRGRCRFRHPPKYDPGRTWMAGTRAQADLFPGRNEAYSVKYFNDLGDESARLEAVAKGTPVTIHLPPKPLPPSKLWSVSYHKQRKKAGFRADERFYSN